jgi:hypothetical protein
MKSMTLRLNNEDAMLLELIARTRNTTVTAEVRAAIHSRVRTLRTDPEFLTSFRKTIEIQQRLAEQFAE